MKVSEFLRDTWQDTWTVLRTGTWINHPRSLIAVRMWALAVVPVFIAVIFSYLQDGLTNGVGKVVGEDFIDFWLGARFALEGNAVGAYDLEGFLAAVREVAGSQTGPYLYSYPPSLMVLSAPFALLPFPWALAAWTIAGVVGLFVLLRPLWGNRNALIAALAAPATFVNAMFGQNGALTAVFLGGGLLLLGSAPIAAGILLGLLSFKPQLGILLPLALALGGHWRAFFAAAATVIALIVVSVAMVGIEAWLLVPERMELMRTIITYEGQGLWHRIPTAFVSARLLGIEPHIAWLIHAPFALGAVVAVVRAWRRADALPSVKAATLVLATLIFTPYAWDYDLVILVVIFAWRLKEGGWRPWEASALAIAVLLPFLLATAAKGLGLPIGPAVMAFALWTVARDQGVAELDTPSPRGEVSS